MEHHQILLAFLLLPLVTFLFIKVIWRSINGVHHHDGGLPPGPWKLPFIGNIHQLILYPLPHRRLRDLALKHGPALMHLQLGDASTVIVSSPDIAKQMLTTHDVNFSNRPLLRSARVFTYDFASLSFTPYGDYWRQLRKVCTLELLSSSRVQTFRSIREDEASKFVATIASRAGSPTNLSRLIYAWTISVTARVAFGGKSSDEQAEFVEIAAEIMREAAGFSLADMFPSRKWLHKISGTEAKLADIRRRLDRVLGNIIADHRSRSITTADPTVNQTEDLIDVLLKLQETGRLDFPSDDDGLKAVIMDVFVGGTETSSTTVTWTMSELLKDQRVLRKAQDEVRQIFSETGTIEEARLGELKYLKLVIKEVLRLRPIAPLLLPRQNSERCEIEGYTIPANTRVIINAWAMGRNPKYWVDPDDFIPERFLDSSVDYIGTNYEFIPFGAGRRMCPGMSFGMANVELQLANLLYHFDWKLHHDGRSFESLDMSETFGVAVKRKYDLCLIPIPYPCHNT